MRSTGRVFLLTSGVVAALLLMHQLPTFSINGAETRPVDLLSDLHASEAEAEEPEQEPALPVKKQPTPKYQPKGVTLIDDYSNGKAGGMNHFYNKLMHVRRDGGTVNIAYFGDSFIEGDILTCDLREMLQAHYGGSGPGWVDCGGGTGSLRPTVTTRYQNITENVVTKKPFNAQLQAISQRYYYAQNGASLRLTGTKFRPHVGNWQKATLFFQTNASFDIQADNGVEAASVSQFEPSTVVQALEITGQTNKLSLKFPHVNRQTRLFGVTLDGEQGVALDNFSMRGTPGFMLAKIPQQTIQDIQHIRPYDLIVLHFGLNVVDDNTSDAMCRTYVNRMKKVVALFREACPEASIVVFSVPDRVQRSADGIHTLRGVERLVKYQRLMASECGIGFLNVHQLMGGRDAMKTYVEKGWAAKDYTHMNYKGGKQIASRIYQSFLAGVENYRREH